LGIFFFVLQREGASYLYETFKPSNTTKDRSHRYQKRNRDSETGSVMADDDGLSVGEYLSRP
jgi:ribosomal protein L34